MKRVFSCYEGLYWRNDAISFLVEGIQDNGGEIIDVHLSYVSIPCKNSERLLILYDDHDNYESIKEFLHDKEDKKNW